MSVAKRIIPCLDIDNGRVVKGTKFKNIRDAGDPVEVAKRYDLEGADEIAFLDITATHENRKTIIDVVEKVADEVFIPLTVGGGVSSFSDVKNLLNAGADKVTINSAAVANPHIIDEISNKIGNQCIVAAIDAKKNEQGNGWKVYTHGGRKETNLDVYEWALEVQKRGVGEILLTSMDRDGTKEGFDIDLLKLISEALTIPVIASGGAGTLEHLKKAVLDGHSDAILAASIFHFSVYSVKEVKEYLKKHGVLVRL
ncbi:MAG: imidazole glycerol phosphate synthase subunit HisF [Gammaproteobacteria bacterium]|nr:imidazole glycerol phosphate synthase subunit HisF [Gammaproteobacteria bacterium]